jgi:Ca2+-binding RTX toxin-like protein
VLGSSLADRLTGDQNANRLDGGLGDDTIEGRGGADTLTGGGGTDTVSYLNSAVGVSVDLASAGAQTGSGDAAGDVLSGFAQLVGSNNADALTGDGAANRIEGGLGADTVSGAAGADTLFGNEGDDQLSGGDGADSLLGGDGADTLAGGAGADTLEGGNDFATDMISYSGTVAVTADLSLSTAQTGAGPASGDVLIGVEGLIGSDLGDLLTGNASANWLVGGAGNDTLSGGAGSDMIDGGTGTDFVSFANAGGGVGVRLDGGVSWAGDAAGDVYVDIENLTGSGFDDEVMGSSAANVLDGGGGSDFLSYANSTAGVTVSLALTTAQTSTGFASGDTLSNFENLTGTGHADRLTGDAGSNAISGGDGDDTIEGGAGSDAMSGGNGTDTLSYANATSAVYLYLYNSGGEWYASGDAYSGFERYQLSGYDDYVFASNAAESIDGGAGHDTVDYYHSTAGVTVDLGVSSAQSGGWAAGDVLTSVESLYGAWDYASRLTGSSGADWLYGGAGNDTIAGGAGDDWIRGDAGADSLAGGDGVDTLELGSRHWGQDATWTTVYVDGRTMTGNSFSAGDVATGFERVVGDNASETLVVTSGVTYFDGNGNPWGYDTVDFSGSTAGVTVNLSLTGAQTSAGLASGMTILDVEGVVGTSQADTLTGTSGMNWIWGSGGADTLSAGDGNDSLFVQADQLSSMSVSGGAGYDALRITGLAGGATIDFTTLANRVNTVEEVDLRNGSNQTATISAADIQAIVGSGNASLLNVRTDFGDVLTIEDPYTSASAGGFTIYQDAAKTVQIAQIAIINADRTY